MGQSRGMSGITLGLTDPMAERLRRAPLFSATDRIAGNPGWFTGSLDRVFVFSGGPQLMFFCIAKTLGEVSLHRHEVE